MTMRKGDDICARKYARVSRLITPLAQAVNADPDPMFVAVSFHIFYVLGKLICVNYRITTGIWLAEH
jgi:hypothetical protein